jgi:pyrroloquinoline quinone (PQQ) biosynthesis protein C
MDFFERLEDARTRWNVLSHPFYVRWERGELTPEELGCYASEYGHAVVALAETAALAASRDPELLEHAEQEADHVALWDDFARAAGAQPGTPRPETSDCVRSWTAAGDELEALAILYAVESGQPEISKTKLAGLVRHYGFALDGPATAYFRLHAELDLGHAEEVRGLIESKARSRDTDRLVGVASTALVGNWKLLDGVVGTTA